MQDYFFHVLQNSAKFSQRRQWHPTPVLLPGKSHGRRSLVGCSPWGRKEWDTTEWLHFHFSLSCIGEGNGNPLQCSCLKNPRDSRACWAAIYDWSYLAATAAKFNNSQNLSHYFTFLFLISMKSLNLETVHIRIYLKIHLSHKANLYLRVEKKKKKKI